MRGRGSSMPIGLRSDDLALERVGADAFLKDLLGPFLGGEQAVVAIVAAALLGGGGHVIPRGLVRDELNDSFRALATSSVGWVPQVSRWKPVRQPNGEQSM